MKSIPPACFNVSPKTLNVSGNGSDYFSSLYAKYGDELAELTKSLAPLREGMLQAGYGADFGDMEAELLYLTVRDLQPEILVEMSPCHGYSTNYILAALTKNQCGKVISLEITEQTFGKPTANVIQGNLLPSVDRSRFELRIGDATTKPTPECDFVFIDSCHEAWFAAWFTKELIPKAKVCFVHDLVVYDETAKSLVPKAATTGIRESYFLLHAMTLANQPLAAVAELEHSVNPALRKKMTPRKAYPERSIIFEGFSCDAKLTRVCDAQQQIMKARQETFFGDRHGAIATIRKIAAENPDDDFTRLHAYQVITDLGYRAWALNDNFPDIGRDTASINSFSDIATFAAALELGTKLGHTAFVRKSLNAANTVGARATAFYPPVYWPYSFEFNRWAGAILRRLPG